MAEGLKNGEPWETSAYALYFEEPYNYYGLILETFSIEGYKREEIIFNEIFRKIGEQEVRNDFQDLDGFVGVLYSRLESDGDVSTAGYNLDETYENNSFSIFVADSTMISGKFSARFIIDEDNEHYPKIVELEDVNFSMQVLSEPPE